VVGDDVSSFSYTIKLPKTRTNTMFFGSIDNFFVDGTPNNNQFDRNKYNYALFFVDNQLIFEALAKYIDSDSFYNIQLVKIGKGWAAAIDNPLQNLVLGDICCDSINWFNATGITKPVLVDYGQLRINELNLTDPNIEEITLATNVLAIVQALCSQNGVNLIVSKQVELLFFLEYLFFGNSQYVPVDETLLEDLDMGIFTTSVSGSPTNLNNCAMVATDAFNWYCPVRFAVSTVTNCNYSFGDCSITDEFYFVGQFCENGFGAEYTFNFSGGVFFEFLPVFPVAPGTRTIILYINSVFYDEQPYDYINGCAFIDVPILDNDFVEFKFHANTSPLGGYTNAQTNQQPAVFVNNFFCEVSRKVVQEENQLLAEGVLYGIGRNLPNITGLEFLTYLIKTFNLRYKYENDTLYLYQYNEFYQVVEFAQNVPDITNRVEIGKVKKEFLNQTYAKTIDFNWKNDGDFYGNRAQKYTWTNGSEIVDTTDVFESDFCSYYKIGDTVRIWDSNYSGTVATDTINVIYETGLRIGKFSNTVATTIADTIPYIVNLFEFETQPTYAQMFETYFNSLFQKVDTQFQITIPFEVFISDIQQIDFSRLWIIAGKYFYLTEISTFTPSAKLRSSTKFISAEGSNFCNLPTIFVQPISQLITAGDTAILTVDSDATSYDWLFNGVSIGENTDTLEIINFGADNVGNYSCIVSNSCGSIISSIAVLTLFAP